ncbi:hypothetical protein A6P54_18020 [Bacillus sp. MKU004]|nr:hypothetical protein A6P54_18020 [Bacillus sp. MKU004]
MNLHALRQFINVVQMGSVTSAAKELHISQPAITMQIRNLEKELGITLFRAKGRGIEITEAGAFIYQQAIKLFIAEEEVEKKIEQYTTGVTGKVRVFATNFPASYLLPKWIANFKKLYPKAEITLYSGNTERALEKLAMYEVDIAIIASPFPISDELEIIHLLEDELFFIVPRSHPLGSKVVEFKDLMNECFILRGEGSSTKALIDSLCHLKQVHLQNVPVQVERIEEAIQIVASGYGITLAPKLAIAPYLKSGLIDIVHIQDIQLSRNIRMCIRKGMDLAPAVRNLKDFILQKNDD